MFDGFCIRCYKGVVEDGVDSLEWGKLQSRVSVCGGKDFKGAMAFWGKFGFWVSCFDICAIKPNQLVICKGV